MVQLPAGYHVANFLRLTRFVRTTYADLLDASEAAYADEFESLSPAARSLYVRLVTRKGPVFRLDRLRYADVRDPAVTASELEAAGFAGRQATAEEMAGLLLRAELEAVLGADPQHRRLSKAALQAMVAAADLAWPDAAGFQVLRPLRLELLSLYRLLFFGNLNQDLTEFVLTEMGVLVYEPYPIADQARRFTSRDSIDRTLLLHRLAEQLELALAEGATERLAAIAAACPDPAGDGTLARRRDRLCNKAARELERQGQFEAALSLYAGSGHPPARERRARILAALGRVDEALALCEAMQRDPIDESELEFASGFGRRLARRAGRAWTDAESPLGHPSLRLTLPQAAKVEEACRQWFEQSSGPCYYVENGLLPGLFGLLFWDIIFHPVPGAFSHPYQRGPADLFTADFRRQRQALLEARLLALDDPLWLRDRAVQVHASRRGIANPFVNWDLLDETLLGVALERLPAHHLKAVFQRLLRDLRNNRSGLPDLICFPREGGYRLIEVKGPGDQLQANQRRWIRAFEAAGMPFLLVWVDWQSC